MVRRELFFGRFLFLRFFFKFGRSAHIIVEYKNKNSPLTGRREYDSLGLFFFFFAQKSYYVILLFFSFTEILLLGFLFEATILGFPFFNFFCFLSILFYKGSPLTFSLFLSRNLTFQEFLLVK